MRKNKQLVYHSYSLSTSKFSAYGKAKAVLEALEPIKHLHDYGYIDSVESITIWWKCEEEV